MEKLKNKKLIANVLSCCTIIIIICILINAYIQYCNYHVMEVKYQDALQTTTHEKDNVIKTILKENRNKADLYLNEISNDIQDKMLKEYKDNLDELKFDIQHPSEDSKLSSILDDELSSVFINKDSCSNKPFVTSSRFIIWNKTATYVQDDSNSSPIPITDFNKTTHNKHLSQLAIDSILNKDNNSELIFWEGKEPLVEHDVISDMDIDQLLQQCDKHGLDVLKSYELLVPIYITNNGDVFGNEDVNSLGVKNNNYKIIIVQRINMYDTIQPYLSDLTFSEDKIAEATNDILILGKTKVGYISISIVISFGIFIVSGYIQNKLNKSEEI